MLLAARVVLPAILMSAEWKPPNEVGVLWDVDGTLVESTKLAFDATNEVLASAGMLTTARWLDRSGCVEL